jgi:hypothetical protein
MKRLRSLLLLFPAEITLAGSLTLLAVIFTVFPEALEHSPVSFETRGWIHHAWHYLLLLAASLTLVSHIRSDPWTARTRLLGLLGLVLALTLNLIAEISADLSNPALRAGGLDIGLRVAAISFLIIRIRMIVNPPTVNVTMDRSS